MTLRNILVPTYLSPGTERAFALAAELAAHHGATLTTVRVSTDPLAPVTGRVTRVHGPSDADGPFGAVSVVNIEVAASSVAAALVAQAVRTDADLVVMGTHGRIGFSRIRLGSVAEPVARAAPCPVLLVREGTDLGGWHPARVLAAVDPEDLSATESATDPVPAPVHWAAELAASFGADLDLLSVVEGSATRGYPSVRRCAAGLLALTARLLQSRESPPRVTYTVRQGDPAEAVVAEAERAGADLVVVGRWARRGLARIAFGSVAEGVSRRSPCPVLIVPPATSVAASVVEAPVWALSADAPFSALAHSQHVTAP